MIRKREIAAAAKQVGLNTSELMRQAAQQFMPKENKRNIELMIEQVKHSTEEAEQALDQALKFIMQSNQRISKLQFQK